jgi:lysozyme
MKPRHKVSRAAVELIKSFEGFREQSAQLPDGSWTIGYGHTKTARAGAKVNEAEAEMLLIYDLQAVTEAVNEWTYTPLTQNQFDALVCFAFNVGLDGFRRSTVLRRINEGAMLQAACSFEMWRKADFEGERIVVDALVRRRAAEKALFLTPTQGWVPAPSPVLQPKVDYEVCNSVPKDKPVDLKTSLVGSVATLVREPEQREDEPETQPDVAPEPSKLAEAGDSVSARLQTIMATPAAASQPAPVAVAAAAPAPVMMSPPWPESTPDDLSSPPPPPAAPQNDPQPELALEAFSAMPARPAPPPVWSGFATTQTEPEHEAPVAANADLFQRPIYREEPDEMDDVAHIDVTKIEPVRMNLLPMIVLGLIGLAVFAGAIVWGFKASATGGLLDPKIIGAVIGLIGIACVGGVVYSMLAKLGRGDEG